MECPSRVIFHDEPKLHVFQNACHISVNERNIELDITTYPNKILRVSVD